MNHRNKRARDIGFYALILLVLLATFFTLNAPKQTRPLLYSEITRLFYEEKVEFFILDGEDLILTLREPVDGISVVSYKLFDIGYFLLHMGSLIDAQVQAGVIKNYDLLSGFVPPWWLQFLPIIAAFIIFGILWYVMVNRATGGGGDKSAMRFGKARTRLGSDETKKVTFADVAGADEEKAELQEVIEFLKNPKAFTEMGARIPKGVLLVGPPGTGKTLIAKAVAGEADVQFLSISGSDFVELYVGVGASRVRDLFDQAKKVAPSIIFIDEIDAVGRQRGAGLGGGHDEREQTLNQLLVEMDGFGNNEGVIVIAATNRKDILDSALLRPGRFDREVYVGRPDIKGREAILRVHSRGKPLGDDVNLNSLARGTPGFTGADLENLMNEAALLAVRLGKRYITMSDLDEAVLKVMAGPEKRSKVISESQKRLTAFHEAGHAVVSKYLEHVDPVHHITIIPRGPAGGMTIFRPTEDKDFQSRSEMFEDIVSSLGGRCAEQLMLNDISTGAGGDIQSATRIARSMVMRYGMSDKLGPISFDSSEQSVFIGRDFAQTKAYSEKVAAEIDDEVRRIFAEAYELCEKILSAHKDILQMTADYLLENETMDGDVFDYLCEHRELPDDDGERVRRGYFDRAETEPENLTANGGADKNRPVFEAGMEWIEEADSE